MLEVEINGVKTIVPQCTCGKCIVRRLRQNMGSNIPYSKNLASTYTTDYPWKNPLKDPGFYNRSKHTGFENQYKETLPNGMLSTMKDDYRPYEVETEKIEKDPTKIFSTPFIGRTMNESQFPNWGAITHEPVEQEKFPEINVPFRGISNYDENYQKYPDQYYKMREPLNFAKSTQKFTGKLNPDTTYGTDYKPYDVKGRENPLENPNLTSYAFLPCDNAPDNFDTTYRNDYIKYDDAMCKLRIYLNQRGMRYLVI